MAMTAAEMPGLSMMSGAKKPFSWLALRRRVVVDLDLAAQVF
jgi:hypothetical protein